MRDLLKIKQLMFLAVACVLIPTLARAEEKFEDLMKRAQDYRAQGKIAQAMDELSWAMKELEKEHMEKLKGFFPQTVAGLTGGEFQQNSALGLVSLERTYADTAGNKVKVTLAGAGNSGGGAAQGMGALAGLAGMAAMMGAGQPGVETVRVKGIRSILTNESNNLELTVPLDIGMTLQVEKQSGKPTKDQIIQLAEGIDIGGMESYAKTK